MNNFDIQLFGTNDTITTAYTLGLGYERSDDSVQYIKLQNPRSDLTADEVQEVMTFIASNNLLLDSKTNEPFSTTDILTAYTENKITTNLDLS